MLLAAGLRVWAPGWGDGFQIVLLVIDSHAGDGSRSLPDVDQQPCSCVPASCRRSSLPQRSLFKEQIAMTTTTTNGQVRRTLASQLDRLDGILDALSDGLNEAVATAVEGAVERAVRQAVGQAVRETLQALATDALTNPDLIAAFRRVAPAAPPPETPPDPPRGLLRRACDGIKAGLAAAGTACAAVLGQVAGVKHVVRAGWQLAKKFKGRVLAACGVGVAAGALTLWAAPWLGAVGASVAGFCTTLAVSARNALRRLFAPGTAFA